MDTNANEKSLQLMNELNVANTRYEDMKRELKELQKQHQFTEKENDDIRGEKIQLRKQL